MKPIKCFQIYGAYYIAPHPKGFKEEDDAKAIIKACNEYEDLLKTVKLFQQFFDEMPKGQLGNIVCDIGILNDAFIASRKCLNKAKE